MNEKILEAVEVFTSELPNLTDIHHPLDIKRLTKILIYSIKEHEDFPYETLKDYLSRKEYCGDIESFMNSVKETVNQLKPGLEWAYNADLLKINEVDKL